MPIEIMVKRRPYKKWTQEDLDFLKKNINKMNNIMLGEILNRGSEDIKKALFRYNMKRSQEAISKFISEGGKKREGTGKKIKYKKVKCQYPELGDCWNCVSHFKNFAGYIQVRRYNKTIQMHRYVYEKFYGSFREELRILHKCDNTSCINPNHLFIGTQRDNVIDMYNKGRGRKTYFEGDIRMHKNGYEYIKKEGKWVYIKRVMDN